MATLEEMRKKYFTEEGVKVIDEKIKLMVSLFNENKFPLNKKMWGFSSLNIETRDECFHRVKELCQILGAECKLETREDDSTEKEVLIY